MRKSWDPYLIALLFSKPVASPSCLPGMYMARCQHKFPDPRSFLCVHVSVLVALQVSVCQFHAYLMAKSVALSNLITSQHLFVLSVFSMVPKFWDFAADGIADFSLVAAPLEKPRCRHKHRLSSRTSRRARSRLRTTLQHPTNIRPISASSSVTSW
ncbi:hypothetical protein DFH29DRAFT_44395 [Suillus ampliporus]|nr:hypothetical protein DFH29DRAFT_44395 [Suillus ampliporus]